MHSCLIGRTLGMNMSGKVFQVSAFEYLHSSSFWMHPFECVAMEEDGKQLPWWTKNEGQPELMAQVQKAIDDGRSYNELCARLMLLRF